MSFLYILIYVIVITRPAKIKSFNVHARGLHGLSHIADRESGDLLIPNWFLWNVRLITCPINKRDSLCSPQSMSVKGQTGLIT